jgi:hypothetical protein
VFGTISQALNNAFYVKMETQWMNLRMYNHNALMNVLMIDPIF